MKKRIEDFTVTENIRETDDLFLLKLRSPEALPEIVPGQFVQVLVEGSDTTFLRRPFSVHDVDRKSNIISLLIQVAGDGTCRLSRLAPGERISLIYPLGKGFTLPAAGEKVLLVGGGSGLAPLLLLGKEIITAGGQPHFAFGFRNSGRIFDLDRYKALGEVHIATEDGSYGYRGYVTALPVLTWAGWDRVYCCGPEPMMKRVAAICREKGFFCEVSLENLMACGLGVCLCCIVPTTSGNLCSCTDGPVFNINDLKWQTSE